MKIACNHQHIIIAGDLATVAATEATARGRRPGKGGRASPVPNYPATGSAPVPIAIAATTAVDGSERGMEGESRVAATGSKRGMEGESRVTDSPWPSAPVLWPDPPPVALQRPDPPLAPARLAVRRGRRRCRRQSAVVARASRGRIHRLRPCSSRIHRSHAHPGRGFVARAPRRPSWSPPSVRHGCHRLRRRSAEVVPINAGRRRRRRRSCLWEEERLGEVWETGRGGR